ncbi:MAG TPA: glucoamylase family protein [Longimicrobiales bacterium]|nr:glucoamylase family protein [Longimicrobiales bacterium]
MRRFLSLLATLVLTGCASSTVSGPTLTPADESFLDEVQERTFGFFWEQANPVNGLVPDRWPTESFSSVAAVGFGLPSYAVGIERGWITRDDGADRVLTTLHFLLHAPQGPEPAGRTGHNGLFYHFLDMQTGTRFDRVELSTIDTALLMAGVLFSQQYFDGVDEDEAYIRALADSLYRRVDWQSMVNNPGRISMGWHPETGFIESEWHGYDEAMILLILALGSPTHPVDESLWTTYMSTARWGQFHGQAHIGFAPLFGHQYSHIFIDFRGIQDPFIRAHGIDWFENSRRAVLAQREYAIANPMGWTGYDADVWGLTASDGPVDTTLVVNGTPRQFWTYTARGASHTAVRDDGTLVPTAAGGSIPFAPGIAVRALRTMRERYPAVWGEYGFLDAFNPSFQYAGIKLTHGRVVPGTGWVDTDYLGIDQGPILLMAENHRTGLIWNHLRRSTYIREGLRRAGFTGGWLDTMEEH